ncbi:hypothetical protein CSA37_05315 [Candidatus Fermentibacteria bacterium]|nr:MAG: hypothetical protein CSA37_05315 [Candidatus Fermentibacteria bacterium]
MSYGLIFILLSLAGSGVPVYGESSSDNTFDIFEPVDRSEYVLGAGDVIQMVLEGGTSEIMLLSGLGSVIQCQVSSDGMVQLSGIGQLQVRGLTIDQAETELQRLVSLYYPGTSIGIGLLQPRTVKVWVNGMVQNPGQYTLSATNRVSDLVRSAGGLSSYSSRRGSMITAQGDSTAVDLHFDRETGMPRSDPFVDGGAVVHFGLVTNPVYIVRPGIRNYNDGYQIPEVETWDHIPGETVSDLMYRIGGIDGNVDLARSMFISRSVASPVWIRGMGISTMEVFAGDTLKLVVQGNDIYVAGAVHQRGIIAYMPGAPVSAYIERAGGTLYNGSRGGTTLTRNGVEIASGDNALEMEVLPGDVIEVPYSWVARHSQEIGILATLVGITSTIIYLTR